MEGPDQTLHPWSAGQRDKVNRGQGPFPWIHPRGKACHTPPLMVTFLPLLP